MSSQLLRIHFVNREIGFAEGGDGNVAWNQHGDRAAASTPSPFFFRSVWPPGFCATAAVSVLWFIFMVNFGFHPLSTEIRELHPNMQR